MTVYEMAEKYYPRLWSLERLDDLVRAGRLSYEEHANLTRNTEVTV